MCGRYYLKISIDKLLEKYGILDEKIVFSPSDEIFPSEKAPIIFNNGNKRVQIAKWGFSSFYGKHLIINARSETLEEKKTFKKSFLKQRCIIPVSGFFEWKKQNREKIKHKIYLKNQEIFSLAGLYDFISDDSGNLTTVFVIITTRANEKIKEIHHRMPVILDNNNEKEWLNPEFYDIKELKNNLLPYPGDNIILEPEKNQLKFNF